MAPVVVKPPKKAKGISKKGKKGWRKNVDISNVEEYLEDKRLEERLGGSFGERADEELFTIDTEIEPTEKEEVDNEAPKKWRKKREEKPLKCFQHLEINGGVDDPVKRRNKVRTQQERRNPKVIEKEVTLAKQGIVKAKTKLQKKHRELEKLKKQATELERTTRRRTKFDFDLWSLDDKDSKKVNENEWLDSTTKLHTLVNTRKLRRKLPEDFHEKTSELTSVDLPDAGMSYNPSLKDHQDLLWKAAIVEINKEKAEHKIEYHTTRMFPSIENAPTKESIRKELIEGIPALDPSMKENDEEENDAKGSDSEEEEPKMFKKKTKVQRNREKREKYQENVKKAESEDKKKRQDVFKLRSMKKQFNVDEQTKKLRAEIKTAKKEAKKSLPAMLSDTRFEEAEIPLKLGEELTGNLRTLKPEGNLLEDRFNSLQKRNVVETRIKKKPIKTKRRKRKVEKRSYKMGFSWEKK